MQSILPSGPMITVNIVDGIANSYTVKHEIASGEGAYGTIYIASKNSNPDKDIIIKRSQLSSQQLVDENKDPIAVLVDGLVTIEMIKKNPHPNIVKYEFAGIDIKKKEIYEVMDYCNNKTVLHNKLTQTEALDACYQVASALDHLHNLNITHRDVKSNNILMHKENGKLIFKLADFGLSCMKNKLKTVTGNLLFRAPEFFDAQPKLTNKIDIWGLGCVFYHVIFRSLLFDDEKEALIENNILKGFTYPQSKAQALRLHPKMQQLFEGMLEKDPIRRFSAKAVMEKINEIKNEGAYTLLGAPIELPGIKMEDAICVAGRGVVKLRDQTYFTMDDYGNVQKINAINNNIINRRQFDVGDADNWCSIIANKAEDCLIISGYNNKNIYAVNPTNLQIKREWENTHISELGRVIFLDNKIFCTGYWDGLLKKCSVDSGTELAAFKICENRITTFYADSNPTQLLVGDSEGILYSMNWQSFNQINWSVKVHKNWINSICKSGSFFATGSHDNSIVLLNSSTPPQVINIIPTDSEVFQLQLTAGGANLLALCVFEFVLFKINAGQLEKLCQKSYKTDFKNQWLHSYALVDDNIVVVGDQGGNLFSMKLLR